MKSVEIKHKSGASVTVALNGATVISWKDSNGKEQLYLSKKNTFEDHQAIRGGIPVVFPQFANGISPCFETLIMFRGQFEEARLC